MKLAVTGGTGFVGAHLIDRALAAGHHIRALTRRDQEPRDGVTWVRGDLSDDDALRRLTEGVDAVIHVAGVLNVPTQREFDVGNVDGTRAALAAASSSKVRKFVFVSSLAAREPGLSMYGASKAKAENIVGKAGIDWAIVRPPAVYGPGDRETLELFKMARLGLMLMPPDGAVSLIHAEDLADLLLALAQPDSPSAQIIEPDDGRNGGWTHRQLAAAIGQAVGRKPLILSAPAPLLHLAARADKLFRGPKAKLTPDRAAYFAHRDWLVDPRRSVPPGLWQARIATPQGLADTAAWYQARHWL